MPSITFQEWEDLVAVSVSDDTVVINAHESVSGRCASVLCSPNEARKLATMLNEIADRVEDER